MTQKIVELTVSASHDVANTLSQVYRINPDKVILKGTDKIANEAINAGFQQSGIVVEIAQ